METLKEAELVELEEDWRWVNGIGDNAYDDIKLLADEIRRQRRVIEGLRKREGRIKWDYMTPLETAFKSKLDPAR